MTTTATLSFPSLTNGAIQVLQLVVDIFSVRAVEGSDQAQFRFVEYITRTKCGSSTAVLATPLLNEPNFDPEEFYMRGRQQGGDDLSDEVINDPPENLFASHYLGHTTQYKYQYFAFSIPVGQVVDSPAAGGAATRAAVEEVSSDDDDDKEEEDSDTCSVDSELSADAEIVETQVGLDELEERFDPNLSDEEEVVETQADW